MFGKINQVKDAVKAQRKIAQLKKELEKVTIEVEENGVKIKAKATVGFMAIDDIEINGDSVPGFNTLRKKAEKEVMKKMQKMIKSGQISPEVMGGMM